jgi:peptidoglycan-associated lipoprotein
MKVIKLLTVSLVLIGLSGCSSLGSSKKDSDAMQNGDVSIEERSADSSGLEGGKAYGSDVNGNSETQVNVGEDGYQDGQLNDPANPLSQRIVYFDYDSSSVRPQDLPILEAHAAYLSAHPNVNIRVEGHTDDRGSREYNLALGERRALAIRQILMLQGASINQFQVTSYGEERLAAEGYDESVWSQNRRVEFTYLGR